MKATWFQQNVRHYLGCFFGGLILGAAFGYYLWGLDVQLTQAFYQQKQLIPTRIYSDVTRITLLQSKKRIEERLTALGYHYPPGGENIRFSLHPIDYPRSLLPEGHVLRAFPEFDESNAPEVTLTFENNSPTAVLTALQIGDVESEDIFLEPEIVSTLSRGTEAQRQIRTYLKFSEIPASIWKAIIAVEDQHFLEHKGLDPRGMARAIWVNLKTFSFSQGGSTITQQLVKNLMVRRTKNIFRKINELFLSLLLEAKFDKEEILERYLNEVYLGQIGQLEIHGIAEGAKYFFGKKIEDLNLAETALIAGLIRGPSYYSPYRNKERAFERQQLVLKKMVETGQLAEAEAESVSKLPIRLVPVQNASDKAPYFTDFVKAELIQSFKDRMNEEEITQAGLRVYTTLDTEVNRQGQLAIAEGIARLEKNFVVKKNSKPKPSSPLVSADLALGLAPQLEGALAAVDHSTGFIRALVGGKRYSASNFNRILNMKRQVGSTFKPFVYLTAFQMGRDSEGVPYAPGHPAEDAPWTLTYDRGKQSWSPRNFEKSNRGWVSYRSAVRYSINMVAARLALEVGIPSIIKTAQALGVESSLPNVPSLSLGVAELSPVELLKAYATIANRGEQEELVVIRSIIQADETEFLQPGNYSVRVFDSAPIDLLHDVLEDAFRQKTRNFEQPAAGKTGTTSNHRDAWYAGYTPQLTTVIWVGMDHDDVKNAAPQFNLTGANSAFPIWLSFMKAALAGQPSRPFPPSPDLVELATDMYTGKRAAAGCPASQVVTEKFMKGFEPSGESCEKSWPAHLPTKIRSGVI